MARKRQSPHPADDDLLALADEDEGTEIDLCAHVKQCGHCIERVAELRATRRLLVELAERQQQPHHDLALGAMMRLRSRHTVISNMNEFLAAFRALVRGVAELLGGAVPTTLPTARPPKDEGLPHG